MARVKVGEKFGRWTVVAHRGTRREGADRYRPACAVECRCGAAAVVFERDLKRGRTRGCKDPECRHRVAATDPMIELWDRLCEEIRQRGHQQLAAYAAGNGAAVALGDEFDAA